MTTGMVVANALCLVALLMLLAQLWRPAALPETGKSFAAVLAELRARHTEPDPPAARGDGAEPRSAAPVEPGSNPPAGGRSAAGEEALPLLPLSERLAVVRHMLQGKSAAMAAEATRVDLEAARALYRMHGRQGG